MADVDTVGTLGWFGTATDRSVSVGIMGWFIEVTAVASAPFSVQITGKKPTINLSGVKPMFSFSGKKPTIKVTGK